MRNLLEMSGRCVLVTGASAGIGEATAVLLAELGCRVVLAARNEERLRATLATLPGDGHLVKAVDLSEVESIEPFLREVTSSVGPLNGIVHSAGTNAIVPLRFQTPTNDDTLWRINYHAARALLLACRKPSIRAPNASVVFVSSIAGLIGRAGLSGYCASKGALQAFSRAAAIELAREHIRVNCVAPGLLDHRMGSLAGDILTDAQHRKLIEFHPLGLGKPEDVANAIVFLLADTGRWITGTTLVVDGGATA